MTSARIICVGAAAVDRKYRAFSPLRADTSNPVVSSRAAGGVARNVAENLARLGVATGLASLLGDDDNGRWLLEGLRRVRVDTRGVEIAPDHATAEYVAVLEPDGTLAYGLADMAIFEAITPGFLDRIATWIGTTTWIFADCNLPGAVLQHLIERRRQGPSRLAINAVSLAKAARLPRDLTGIDLLFLNEGEAAAILGVPRPPAEAAVALHERGAAGIVLTCGAQGLVTADASGVACVPAHSGPLVDVTGAGDALIAATLFRLLAGDGLAQAAVWGAAAAALTVASEASVRPDLSPRLLARAMEAVRQPSSR